MSSRFLIDTNHLGEAVNRVSVVRDRIQQMHHEDGAVFGTCGPVLCELVVGIVFRKDIDATRRRLEGLLQIVRVWPVTLDTAEEYAKTYHELRNAGRALSQVDILLASLSRQFDTCLLTADNDFAVLADIHTENWLTS
jgi:predicted nucleic acid-binding protein